MSLEFTGGHRRNREEDATSVPLAPLIDMIFILLIFFLVTASFTRTSGLDITKPEAAAGTRLTEEHPVVTIQADGAITIDEEPIQLEGMGPRIKQRMSVTGSNRVVVAADKQVSTELLVSVIDQCKNAGAEQISIATRKTP